VMKEQDRQQAEKLQTMLGISESVIMRDRWRYHRPH
jgi:hypothetical protein